MIALRCELKRKELKEDDMARAAELAAYFTHCNLQVGGGWGGQVWSLGVTERELMATTAKVGALSMLLPYLCASHAIIASRVACSFNVKPPAWTAQRSRQPSVLLVPVVLSCKGMQFVVQSDDPLPSVLVAAVLLLHFRSLCTRL